MNEEGSKPRYQLIQKKAHHFIVGNVKIYQNFKQDTHDERKHTQLLVTKEIFNAYMTLKIKTITTKHVLSIGWFMFSHYMILYFFIKITTKMPKLCFMLLLVYKILVGKIPSQILKT